MTDQADLLNRLERGGWLGQAGAFFQRTVPVVVLDDLTQPGATDALRIRPSSAAAVVSATAQKIAFTLFNPAGSGVLAVIEAIHLSTNSDAFWIGQAVDAAYATNTAESVQALDTRARNVDLISPIDFFSHVALASTLGTPSWAYHSWNIGPSAPLSAVLRPGTGFAYETDAAVTTKVATHIKFKEIPLPLVT